MEGRPASARVAPLQDWWWIFDPRYSLRARAALLCAAGAALVTLLVGWIASSSLRRSLETHYGATFEALAVQIADKIDRTVFERYRTLRLAADLAIIRRADASPAERRLALTSVQESAGEFGWIGFLDTTGRVVAATGQLFENADHSQRPWFLGARERPYVGTVRDSPELAREIRNPDDPDAPVRFFDLAVPVAGANGMFGGVIAAHLRWGWARDVQLSVVAEPALRARMAVTIYGGASEVLLDTANLGWSDPPPPPSVPETRRFRGSLIERTPAGAFLTGYARSRGFREYRGPGWFTIVRQPVERVLAPVSQLQRSVLGWGLIFTALAATLGWLLAGRLSQRFRKIRSAAERIREGDVLTVLPRPNDDSEIARMCGSLGDLVEDLRAKQEALARENARLAAKSRKNDSVKP